MAALLASLLHLVALAVLWWPLSLATLPLRAAQAGERLLARACGLYLGLLQVGAHESAQSAAAAP